jgi:hypothetical protein
MQNSNVQDETPSATEDNSIVDSRELENLEDNRSTLNSQQTSERTPKHKTDQPEMDNQLMPSSPANPISAPHRPRPQLSINTTLPPLSPVNFVPAPHRPQPQLSITTTVYPPRSATVVSWADGLPPQPSNKLWDDSNVYFPHWSASCESFLTKYQLPANHSKPNISTSVPPYLVKYLGIKAWTEESSQPEINLPFVVVLSACISQWRMLSIIPTTTDDKNGIFETKKGVRDMLYSLFRERDKLQKIYSVRPTSDYRTLLFLSSYLGQEVVVKNKDDGFEWTGEIRGVWPNTKGMSNKGRVNLDGWNQKEKTPYSPWLSLQDYGLWWKVEVIGGWKDFDTLFPLTDDEAAA